MFFSILYSYLLDARPLLFFVKSKSHAKKNSNCVSMWMWHANEKSLSNPKKKINQCSAISTTNVMNERPSTSKETISNVGSPSPRKHRTNSTPLKRNPSEKKMILQQLISPYKTPKVRGDFNSIFARRANLMFLSFFFCSRRLLSTS